MELIPVMQPTKNKLKRARLGQLEADHQKIWDSLRAVKSGHPRELAKATGLHENKVGFYMNFLERAGYLWLEPGQRLRRFWLINDTGSLAPRRLRGGQSVADDNTGETYAVPEVINRWPDAPAAVNSPDQKSWLAMRMLRTFTISELQTVTELGKRVLQRRVRQLMQFNYLRRTESSAGEAGYMLPQYRNTGPRAPAISSELNRLYDHNTKEIIVFQGE